LGFRVCGFTSSNWTGLEHRSPFASHAAQDEVVRASLCARFQERELCERAEEGGDEGREAVDELEKWLAQRRLVSTCDPGPAE
jgi:hypothetical protein